MFNKPVEYLADQLAGIRPGNLSIGFVETFKFENEQLRNIAIVSQVKDRIHVIPHDKTKVAGITKTLMSGKLNAYALNPSTICITIPPISGEQIQEMAKHIKKLGEEAMVSVRNIRQNLRKKNVDFNEKDVVSSVNKIDEMVKRKIKSL